MVLVTELKKHLRKYQIHPDRLTQETVDRLAEIVVADIRDMDDYRGLTETELREVAGFIIQGGMGEFEVLLTDGELMAEGIERTKEMEREGRGIEQ